MPRRISTRAVTSSPQAPPPPQPDTPYDSNVRQLRRHWKWAAFSQFFFTFSPLLAMTDVILADVENDLVHSTNRVLSRVMQRLLTTLTQDRKITADSWQNALRRQYQRRDPEASPIGPMIRSYYSIVESSRASTAPPGPLSEVLPDEAERDNEPPERDQSTTLSPGNAVCGEGLAEDLGHASVTKVEEEDTSSESLEALEKQLDWLDLSMLAKLESLHTLAEWQFQNPHRLRHQMKTDDEQATWRIEPIGYDAKGNAYWLIGSDRLWIQREPPRPNLKRKRTRKPGGDSRNIAKKQLQSLSVKRRRVDSNLGTVGQSSGARPTRGKAQLQPFPSPREGRAAKTRANQRLDAQARDLAAFQRHMARTTSISPRKPTGVRVSARLRGTAVEDDEWQEVPDEWLAVNDTHQKYAEDPPTGSVPTSKKRLKTGLESEDSSISELTELSDGEDGAEGGELDFHEIPVVHTEEMSPPLTEKDTDTEIEDLQDGEAIFIDPNLPDDFVEWETICVTLEEWESIEQRFEKATHYAEKALHKVLSRSIVPMVTTELRETEKKRRMEEAVVYRKRSSRIAMKEIEKEEERATIRKRMEVEEKTSRARRLEVRHQREQAERLRRENVREQRRKERELLEDQQSAETGEAESKPDASVGVIQQETISDLLPPEQSKAPVTLSAAPINGTGSGSRSPVENWELDCEVCGRKGINQDGGVPLLCCGTCGKWQHIFCHDKQDTMAGHPKRNWDVEDFICRQCRLMNCKSSSPTSFHSFGVNTKNGQASRTQVCYVAPSNHLKNHSDNGHHQDLSSNGRYPCDHSDLRTAVPSPSPHPCTSQARSTGVTFAHYQPQQGGFSTSRPTYSLQDVHAPQNARYTITPQTVSATGITPYASTANPQAVTHSPVHEQWYPSSYPRTVNSYPLNGGPPLVAQGVQPYYNGHAHTSYSHIRGTTNPTVLGQYTGLRHVPSYQHSK